MAQCDDLLWSLTHKCPKMAKENENLVISGEAGLVADVESESCEIAKSNDAEDAFVCVSQGEHEFCFGSLRGERRG